MMPSLALNAPHRWLLGSLLATTGPLTAVAPPSPLPPVPTPRQLAWQEREYIAFVHFGVNTFTGREWGEGTEDEKLFNPTDLDCRQWARAFKAAGMKLVILTAKHHDGFCLWPSAYTEHSVKNSPWRGGKGDVVRELSEACRAEGLDFGVYLSPWDRHEPTYGQGEAYDRYYLNQLTELLTHYGRISEVWFDGANGEGPNGKKQVYNFAAYYAKVRELQPDAVMFGGPDIRWVGNENGYAADPTWSVVDLGKPSAHWLPAEVDVSIRPGWFYHANEDAQVKSLDKLVDIYYSSVGLNGLLLLNVPPDRRGLIHDTDVTRLRELRAVIDATFATDLARGKPAAASNTRGGDAAYDGAKALDGDPATYWATDDGSTSATLDVDLGQPATFNRVMIQEPIALGQRIKRFRVEAWDGAAWKPLGSGQTVGYKRLLRVPDTTTTKVRLLIEDALACPLVSNFGLYREPAR